MHLGIPPAYILSKKNHYEQYFLVILTGIYKIENKNIFFYFFDSKLMFMANTLLKYQCLHLDFKQF
jgi:hypothetical protein